MQVLFKLNSNELREIIAAYAKTKGYEIDLSTARFDFEFEEDTRYMSFFADVSGTLTTAARIEAIKQGWNAKSPDPLG